jgi:hypothetical protein
MAWFKDRTSQNEAALRVEQRKNATIHLKDSAVAAVVLVTLVSGVYMVFRFVRRAARPRQRE